VDDKLREMARQACADTGYDEMAADELLGERHPDVSLHDRNRALDYALANRPAAHLPDGSVVATTQQVWIKDYPDSDHQWSCSDGCPSDDTDIDRYLALDLQVLRVGTGKG
jgi:hypothetical protein